MSQLPMMPVFPDALVSDTMHLNAEEFGCYCLILFATWRNNGKPFSNERDLAHICRIPLRRWRSHMRDRLAPFFTLTDAGVGTYSRLEWRQSRLEYEWAKSQRKAEVSRQNAVSARDKLRILKQRDSGIVSESELPGMSIQSQNSKLKENAGARAKPNGHGEEGLTPNGSFGSLRSPAASPPLKAHKKEQLRQKLMRFVHATRPPGEVSACFLGLMGEDPEHSAQWWLDTLDLAMRAQHWDDRE